MALSPEGAEMTKTNSKSGWSRLRPVQLGAALLLTIGVMSAVATVAAARVPDPMVAYGPPSAPISVSVAPVEPAEDSSAPAPFVSTDPSIVTDVPAVSAEVVVAPAVVAAEVDAVIADEPIVEVEATPTATSSVSESPEMVASSWSMDPLPEGEGGIIGSSTSVDPVTPTSSIVASPQ